MPALVEATLIVVAAITFTYGLVLLFTEFSSYAVYLFITFLLIAIYFYFQRARPWSAMDTPQYIQSRSRSRSFGNALVGFVIFSVIAPSILAKIALLLE
jgi:hypothetical protein